MIYYSSVEKAFSRISGVENQTTKTPYIVVDNYPMLGFLTALRFLEWADENPEGVMSLPTGKTPEYFIKWVHYLLGNWADPSLEKLRKEHGLSQSKKPDLSQLQFVQIDEFYPINPNQHNSFYNYVHRYYVDGFGLGPERSLFMSCDEMPKNSNLSLSEIFPNEKVDLSLRYRDPQSSLEEIQQKTIFSVDQWCSNYESKIQQKGGIGFFLGGIGPDGHIAFNVRGSDHNSTTRLMGTNFETQATAASDLGGIELSRNRLVITIGLQSITANPDAVAIIIAAGEAKAKVVKDSLESEPDNQFPATVLQKLNGGRFYLTQGAASQLTDIQKLKWETGPFHQKKIEKAVIQLCKSSHTYGHKLTMDDLRNDQNCSQIPNLDEATVPSVLKSMEAKIHKGMTIPDGQSFLHTGPHHDDIILGYLPHVIHLVRSPNNKHCFANMTSGFTSVTNPYVISVLEKTQELLSNGKIQMTMYADFFESGYTLKQDKDIYHYLDRIASQNIEGQKRGLSHRIVRALVNIYRLKSIQELEDQIHSILQDLRQCYDGQKNKPNIQKLKGMIREFEEELVWAHYGVQVKDVHHLRLGFYQGDTFTEAPEHERDVKPILQLLRDRNPDVITLALDPEGSGPDTHYKVLQAIADALRMWGEEKDLSQVHVWGYRNVWFRFDPSEADMIVPVSINSMAMLRDTFMNCYLSQKDASFPSYELDGPFCDLTQKIWVDQHQEMELVMGRDYWYQNEHPRLRATHGLVYLKDMSADDFIQEAQVLEKSMEGQIK
ncbi:MAG: glucosamine-6-phosphate isomerase [Candidatus Marinimicrobia bacterium]|jgi:glucosamine-6-phosphate deaminase|nr:glucosamine-6-phosphate isomerase [Candidatus Neomarinimicrobiota bacterium]MBT3936344.1 glucosamine-6-phosphate isomerase [Candidatus Neomarinimicrobiota bacterium]MBT3960296.1 glucosamine-6-phosphate isomerase [Candidatus Neomarinimicrobiota bacterium]MBT4383384.1 glucosamine-6-phosphate isomerase [Candidatus Neomarinimicrobiota bacterium]MBT4635397.1 glucosamine-6-phosphate isomerase [Candidatus Neomarinimicrobiota bacterium]